MILPREKLPDTWVATRISEISQIIMGQAPPSTSYNEEEHGLPLIAGASDLGQEYPIPSRWTTSPTSICQAQDIIFCIRATIGDLNWADRKYCLGRGVAAVRVNENLVDRFFLYYWLSINKEYFIRKGTGTTFLQIRRRDLENALIWLPTLLEQREIVKILRQVDHLRRLRAEADKKSSSLLFSIFNQMFQRPKSSWIRCRLGDVISLEAGKNIAANPEPAGVGKWGILKVSAVTCGTFLPQENKELPDDVLPNLEYRVQKNDLLITRANTAELVGASAIVRDISQNLLLPDKIWRSVFDRKYESNPYFLYGLLNTPYIRNEISRRATGTSGSMKNISQSSFLDIKIQLPHIDEQQLYADAMMITWQTIYDNQAITQDEMAKLLRVLQINAFTGQLTENYRQQNLAELTRLANTRDLALSQPTFAEQFKETELVQKRSIVDLFLSSSQRNLLTLIEEQNSYITDNDLGISGDLSPNETRRNLDLLARLGLVKVAQISVTPGELGHIFFTKIYRALRSEDDICKADLAILDEAGKQ